MIRACAYVVTLALRRRVVGGPTSAALPTSGRFPSAWQGRHAKSLRSPLICPKMQFGPPFLKNKTKFRKKILKKFVHIDENT